MASIAQHTSQQRKRMRLLMLGAGACVVIAALALIRYAARDAFAYFYTPRTFMEARAAGKISPDTRIRLGGLVKTASLVRNNDLETYFIIGDGTAEVGILCPRECTVRLPDLFREGQGIIVEGRMRFISTGNTTGAATQKTTGIPGNTASGDANSGDIAKAAGTASVSVQTTNATNTASRALLSTHPEAAQDMIFFASSILAKHDERYIPRNVAEELKRKGLWQGEQGKK